MSALTTALGPLAALVLTGFFLGRTRVLGEQGARVLARVVFTVAIPALLVVTLGRADLHAVLSRTAAATVVSTGVVVVGVACVVRLAWRRPAGEAAITTLAASYVNAVHLGLPLAMFLFADAVVIVPTLLLQQLVLAPLAIVVLEADSVAGRSRAQVIRATGARILRNPIILATAAGLAVAGAGWHLPDIVVTPLELLGATAAPLALLVLGATLAVPRTPGQRAPRRELWFATAVKSFVHPAVAAAVAMLLGLDAHGVLVVTTMAALPTAQNVLVYALAYQRGQAVARDVGLFSTLLLVPVLLTVTAVLG